MQPKYFDIHAHTHFAAYGSESESLIRTTVENGTWIINVGTQLDTSRAAVELAHRLANRGPSSLVPSNVEGVPGEDGPLNHGVYATVGLHPLHTTKSHHDEAELGGGEAARAFTSRGEDFDPERYRTLALDPKTVAIGECGLDYYRLDRETKEKQATAFEKQIQFANDVAKPLMLHIRDGKTSRDSTGEAYRDALAILRRGARVCGNVHFFAGSIEIARQFLELGFTLSFTGVLTFTHDYDDVVRYAPLDMLLSETDSPYIAPVPHRGKRNQPAYVQEVVKAMARIRELEEGEMARILVANARRVFLTGVVES